MTNSTSPSAATGFVLFKPTHDRGKVKDINGIINDMRASWLL